MTQNESLIDDNNPIFHFFKALKNHIYMSESQEKTYKKPVEFETQLKEVKSDKVVKNFTLEQKWGKKRCDCCYDLATTKYYDPNLQVWFDVCENCKKFLEVEEQLESIMSALDDQIKKKIKTKMKSEESHY